jgi:RHS repeat-associated protein
MVLRDRDAGGDGVFEQRLYVQQDANFNVTSISDDTGTVVERYAYDPYGAVTYLDANWGVLGSSAYGWVYLHQGGRYDSTGGLYHFRLRDYSSSLGRWLQNDPIGYVAGDLNLYRYVVGNPSTLVDPTGLQPLPDNLDYSCNCGWIDWTHAKPAALGDLWKSIERARNEKAHFVFSIGKGGWAGFLFAASRTYVIDPNLTMEQRIRVALAIWMDLSRVHERGQWPFRSSFSEEDLPSNMIAFYMAVDNLSKEAVAKKCGVIPRETAQKLFDRQGGMGTNKDFKPVDRNAMANEICPGTCPEAMKWPFDSYTPAPEGNGWKGVVPDGAMAAPPA